MPHGILELEWASLSPESRTALEARLIEAFVQGVIQERGRSDPWKRESAEGMARQRLAAGTLGEPEQPPF